MKSGNAIEVKDVTRSFKVYLDRGKSIKEFALFQKRRKYEKREVLRGINMEVGVGEAVGLIGHNGCGKSTTLKILTRILYPETGSVEVKGRVSSLIELGAGFHPDMSGRENIYTNASIFGLTRKEIERRVEDIIAFSELEDFIDNPVRTYSSGMYMRLAFSVAINVDADVLLIDEILAVGDANFQMKCFDKLKEIKKNGTTIVIVSHSLEQIEQICDRSFWIHEGLVKAQGRPKEVHAAYLDYMDDKRKEQEQKELDRQIALGNIDPEKNPKRWGNGEAKYTEIALYDQQGKETNAFPMYGDIHVRLKYQVTKPIKNAIVGMAVYRLDGAHCYGTNTKIDRYEKFDLDEDGWVELILRKVDLLPSRYVLDFSIEAEDGSPVDFFREAAQIQVLSDSAEVGVMSMEHEWIFHKETDHGADFGTGRDG